MILKWKDLFYGEHFIDGCDHVALLSAWGLDDVPGEDSAPDGLPAYGVIHGAETVIWGDGREPGDPAMQRQLAHLAKANDSRPPQTVFVLTTQRAAGGGGGRDGSLGVHLVHRMRCVGMWLCSDRGDTIERFV